MRTGSLSSRSARASCAGALLLLAVAVGGCPADPVEETSSSDAVMVTEGRITAAMNRYLDNRFPEPYEQFVVTAMFPRFDLEYADLADGLLAAQVPDPDLALDTCAPPIPVLNLHKRRPRPGDTAMELLDVGNLSLELDDELRTVPTRTFPDLLKVIDGVTYSAEEPQEARYLPGDAYTFRATGGDAVGPFEVVLEAPDDLGEVRVDGVVPTEQVPIVERGEDVEITWEGQGYGDEVVAEFNWTSLGLPWKMTCRMRDDGAFVIPGELTRALQDPLRTGDEELTLSRVRQVAFRSQGLTSGWFAFVVSARFRVRFESTR